MMQLFNIRVLLLVEPDVESISSESTDKTDVDMKDTSPKSESPTPSGSYSFKPASCDELFRGAVKSGWYLIFSVCPRSGFSCTTVSSFTYCASKLHMY